MAVLDIFDATGDYCYDRLRAGHQPACVNTCPPGALQAGSISDIRDMAKDAMDKGFQVYGIKETSWIYIFPRGVDVKKLINKKSGEKVSQKNEKVIISV